MNPRVSIIIPFYNCPYIEQAVQSALSQTYPHTEIIVVDDGSSVHAERLAPYRGHIYYLGKANGGTASALNHGIRHASGEYIAWLSSDDLFAPQKIEMQLNFMLGQGAEISHTNFHYIDEHGRITQYNAGMQPLGMRELANTLYSGNPINGCTVMIKRSLIQRVGLFDEGLPYTHDYDLWHRVMLSRTAFPYLNVPLISYRRHSGMGTLRHQAAISAEIRFIQNRYRDALTHLIATS
ncbi:glycosyltransferase [Paenibacillus barengoltzii]|uniref:glycosyltransferase n=1 Tax=Paenibacillus barengoltzii TaxID=343517 RepID=UPI000FD7FC9D|nr:glycosyltransferase [Paenibacillus barengoltzii]MEC2343357.1 glycosyltransferase [Paenibacillus barengoltzii]